MKNTRRILAGLLVLLVLLGCRTLTSGLPAPAPANPPASAETPSGPALQLPTLTGNWQITMNMSGGIMGMSRQVEVSNNGNVTVTDMRSNKSSSTRLSSADLTALDQLVTGSKYYPADSPSTCADCFVYDLEISSGGQKFQAHVDQVTLPASGLQPLVDLLTQVMNTPAK